MTEHRPRVYGADHDDPHPYAEPGHAYVALVGGPLDGLLVDVTGCTEQEIHEGAALITEIGAYGGGRAWYSTRGDGTTRWHWDGDSP